MVNKVPSDKEILKKIDDAFTGLDQQRASGLESLKILQTIKDNAVQREKPKLTQKYNADNHRVKKIADRINYNKDLQRELDIEIEKTKITIPEFDVNSWLVHGLVVNPEGTPLIGLTVSLYDEDGNWIKKLGYVCTDERGYFAIKYIVKSEEKPEIQDTPKLILTVTDSDSNILHQETDPLYQKKGQIDYRLIVIKDKGNICTPPTPGDGGTVVVPQDVWVARGVVLFEDKSPGAGMTISLYDKDLIFDDVLGTVLTDDVGQFQFIYRTEAFRDLFEKKPDLYLKVMDSEGNTLYTSEKTVRCDAGLEEVFNIKIARK